MLRKSVSDDIISVNNNIFNQTKTTEITKISPSCNITKPHSELNRVRGIYII